MDFELGKKSGQIPAFGDWDNASELPITQYFETARQAGLIRYNATATTAHHHHHQHQNHNQYYYDDHHPYNINNRGAAGGGYHGCACNDLYAADFLQKPPIRVVRVPNHKAEIHGGLGLDDDNGRRRRRGGGRPPHLKEQKLRIKEAYGDDDGAAEVDLKHQQQQRNNHRTRRSSTSASSHQLYCQQKKQQFPKHSAPIIHDHHLLPPTHNTNKPTSVLPPNTVSFDKVKPVDEDLYKIPPELLLHHSKRGILITVVHSIEVIFNKF
ncbi:OLC1v1025845C1 [Oldenlandia corymbosa var. corymbosa]|uniref:OLC1v1025845C1 n=1 Tax=Oldenlandia corymbosa var. corymbosa TaxID=529605 RepID=A0AAV1C932_OLDCO|nr:OLC1v1025845C1 [Oldenlandia corymbosa var. corymbosa]